MRSRTGSGHIPSQRQLRVGEMVRHALVTLLQRGEIVDPEIEHGIVSINQVEMSPDLKIATVFLSPLGGGDAERPRQGFCPKS